MTFFGAALLAEIVLRDRLGRLLVRHGEVVNLVP